MVVSAQEVAKRRKENFDRERIEVRAEAAWIAKVAAEAERLGLSLSAFIRLAVNERMEERADLRKSRRSK
jgi:hypothetical protein